jgi:hypothetical protein
MPPVRRFLIVLVLVLVLVLEVRASSPKLPRGDARIRDRLPAPDLVPEGSDERSYN